MKLSIPCFKCSNAGLTLGNNFVQIDESNEYDHTCINGHRSCFIISNPKYQLLFESGIEAIKDGYYREAVVNFAASLERYLEFYTVVLIRERNPEFDVDQFDKVWKTMRQQSERQLGAFWMLFYTYFNRAAPLFDGKFLKTHDINLDIKGNDPVHFRNIVTHQGIYTTYNQAVNYGESINIYISELIELGRQKSTSFSRTILDTAHKPPFYHPGVHPFHAGRTFFYGDELVRILLSTHLYISPVVPNVTPSLFEKLPLK